MAKLQDSGWCSMLFEDVASLWKENHFCDVTIVAKDGRKFSAHSIILSAASPVLKEMITSGNKELTFDKSSGETCSAMLNFIYTGEVDFMDDKHDSRQVKEMKELVQSLQLSSVLEEMLQHIFDTIRKESRTKSTEKLKPKTTSKKATSSRNLPDNIKIESPTDESYGWKVSAIDTRKTGVKRKSLENRRTSVKRRGSEDQNSVFESEQGNSNEQFTEETQQIKDEDTDYEDIMDADAYPSDSTVDYSSEDPDFEITQKKTKKPKTPRKVPKLNVASLDASRRADGSESETGTEVQLANVGMLKAKCGFCGMVSKYQVMRRHVYEQHFTEITNNKEKPSMREPLKIKCLVCGDTLAKKDYEVHLFMQHPSPADKKTNRGRCHKVKVGCLLCDVIVRNMDYMDHLAEAHPEEAKQFLETAPKAHEGSRYERASGSLLNTVNHLLVVACAYCVDTATSITCDKYKAHIRDFHPDFAEKGVPSLDPDNPENDPVIEQTKRMTEKSKYLFVDRSGHLPEKSPPPDVYVCQICGEGCKERRDFLLHGREKHGFPPKMQTCSFCFMFFRTAADKVNHEDEAHAIEKYLCETCGKDFVRSSSLKIHKESVHLGIKRKSELIKKRRRRNMNLLCNFCGMSFTQTSHIKTHIAAKHFGLKQYKCTVCSKSFACSSTLRKHVPIHSDINKRKYSCLFCTFKTHIRHNFHAHLRIHTGEKPFKCNICGSRFRISLSLRGHFEHKHGVKIGGQGAFQDFYHPENGEENSEAKRILESMRNDSDEELGITYNHGVKQVEEKRSVGEEGGKEEPESVESDESNVSHVLQSVDKLPEKREQKETGTQKESYKEEHPADIKGIMGASLAGTGHEQLLRTMHLPISEPHAVGTPSEAFENRRHPALPGQVTSAASGAQNCTEVDPSYFTYAPLYQPPYNMYY